MESILSRQVPQDLRQRKRRFIAAADHSALFYPLDQPHTPAYTSLEK
jgi:hypothetical protein